MLFKTFLFSSFLFLISCSDSLSSPSSDTAPDLIGDWYIPLGNLQYQYDYTFRTDTNALNFKRQDIRVDIRQYTDTDYTYTFSNSETGILLSHISSPIEKSGTYYSGYFNKDTVILVDTLKLFIPQFPNKGDKWKLWNNHQMEVIAIDTTILLEFYANYNSNNLSPHEVVVYRESWELNEIYHFYEANLGLVAQQRNFNGHLISWGELTSLY